MICYDKTRKFKQKLIENVNGEKIQIVKNKNTSCVKSRLVEVSAILILDFLQNYRGSGRYAEFMLETNLDFLLCIPALIHQSLGSQFSSEKLPFREKTPIKELCESRPESLQRIACCKQVFG
jgi:hypothetical protein